jgi:uncharacterized protein (TIGR02145 family)
VTSVSDYDNNSYNTVSIGTQCWIKENLKVTKYNDGTLISLDSSGGPRGTSGTWAATTGAYAIYGNQSSTGANATNYGFLYNWYAAAGIVTPGGTSTKNICPSGYHVPTDSDFNKLVKFIDSGADTTGIEPQSATAGTLMKKDTTLWTTNTGTNTSGFSALPGGFRGVNGSFSSIRNNAYFWSATESSTTTFAWYRSVWFYDGSVYRGYFYKSVGAPVRCLRD